MRVRSSRLRRKRSSESIRMIAFYWMQVQRLGIWRIIPDIPITVLTNSIKVAAELSTKERVQVISTGGILAHRSLSFVGPLAERSLDAYYVDKAFLSCKGVHIERVLSESNESLQARIKHQMIGMADETILLADASKFGMQAFAQVADLSQVNLIITDQRLTEAEAAPYRALGIPVESV